MIKYLKFLIINFLLTSFLYANDFRDVEQYIEINEYSKALEILQNIAPNNKEDVARQSYLIGEIYFALGKVSKAEDFYEDANMKSPANGVYASAYAKAMMALGKFNDAKELAQRVIDEDFNVIQAHIVLATIDERLGKLSEAKKRFDNLINLQPQSEIIHVAYAEFLDLRVSSFEGINLLDRYLKRYPQSPKALDYLGSIYLYLNDMPNSVKFKSQAAEIYKSRGQNIYADSINDWLKKNEKSLNNSDDEDSKVISNEEITVQTQEPSVKYQNPNLIEPWPIENGEYAYTGSGFITNKGKEVITNRHVIEDAKRLYVRNGYGELRSAKVLKMSGSDDIALLKVLPILTLCLFCPSPKLVINIENISVRRELSSVEV